MPKTKEKKATVNIGGGATATFGQFDFKSEYTDWKNKCSSYKREKISPIAKKEGRKRPVKVPEDLYEQLKEHATASYVRPESPNKGNDGFKFLLDEIEDALMKKQIFTSDDLNTLEKYRKEILNMLSPTSTLNPRNITFKSPASFKIKNGEVVVRRTKKGTKKKTYYGHYGNDYFQAKYKIKVDNTWWSNEKNTAKPPLYQAIAGGDLFPKGLIDVIDDAIDEIESKPFVLEGISSLKTSQMPEVQSFIHSNYKKFMQNNNIQGFLNLLNSTKFTPTKRSIPILESIKELKVPAGELKEFGLQIKTTSAMRNLIENVYRNNSRITKPEIKKAWFDFVKSEVILW